jgi:hypothetical protein
MKEGATRVICQRFEGVDLAAPTPVERVEATAGSTADRVNEAPAGGR